MKRESHINEASIAIPGRSSIVVNVSNMTFVDGGSAIRRVYRLFNPLALWYWAKKGQTPPPFYAFVEQQVIEDAYQRVRSSCCCVLIPIDLSM